MAVDVASMEVTLWRWKSPGGMEVPGEKKEGEKQRAESLSGSKDVGNERLAARCSYFIGMGV